MVTADASAETSRLQDAVRVLLLIAKAGEPLEQPLPEEAPPEAVAVLRTEVALQKLDFWLRNPDYLADLLLDRYELDHDPGVLHQARSILESEEPEVRRYPMLRFRFGAYEPLDNALAVLASPRLVIHRKSGSIGHTRQHNYYLTAQGRHVADQIVADVPELRYYVDRVQLIVGLTSGISGTGLKDLQYTQPEYTDTAWRSPITAITARVRKRLADLETQAAA